MRTVREYDLGHIAINEERVADQRLEMPQGASVLGIQMKSGDIFVCVEVDDAAPLIRRRFFLFKKGQPIPDGLSYVGTGVGYRKGEPFGDKPGQYKLIAYSAHVYTDRIEYDT
jgi:hypothetical protein